MNSQNRTLRFDQELHQVTVSFNILQCIWFTLPGLFQTGYLLLIAVMLVSRTYCDVWMIQNGTLIERYLFIHFLLWEVVVCLVVKHCCYKQKTKPNQTKTGEGV